MKVDFYFCGFPCQSFSIAGKKEGFNDPRGTIFYQCYNYISSKKPKVFIVTNKLLKKHHLSKLLSSLKKSKIEYKTILINDGEKEKNF